MQTHLLFIARMRIVPFIGAEPAKWNVFKKHHQQTIHPINKQVIFILRMPEDEENKDEIRHNNALMKFRYNAYNVSVRPGDMYYTTCMP